MNKKFAYIIIVINLILIVLLLFGFFSSRLKNHVVFVDNVKVFNGFTMTKELKSIGEKRLSDQNKQLDSVYSVLNDPATTANKPELVKQAIAIKQAMEEYHHQFATENSENIWKRINAYAKDFAAENQYQIIIGNQNSDNILYGDEKSDVTQSLLAFINEKYEGL